MMSEGGRSTLDWVVDFATLLGFVISISAIKDTILLVLTLAIISAFALGTFIWRNRESGFYDELVSQNVIPEPSITQRVKEFVPFFQNPIRRTVNRCYHNHRNFIEDIEEETNREIKIDEHAKMTRRELVSELSEFYPEDEIDEARLDEKIRDLE